MRTLILTLALLLPCAAEAATPIRNIAAAPVRLAVRIVRPPLRIVRELPPAKLARAIVIQPLCRLAD